MLHGAQSNHRLSLKRVFGFSNQEGENDLEATRYFQQWADVDYIVASPLARGTMGYKGIPEKDVWDVVADVKRRFHIDEDRTYLTGLSMGGGGTLWIGLTRPDVWAAIAPVCPAPPFGTVERAPNALNFPVHFFQGGADPVVNPEGTRQWRKRLEDLGTKVEYVEYPGVQHNSWEKAYADEAIFKWFGQFKRNKFPDRVRFVTDAYQYGGAYWVKFDKLTPGTFAKIDAQFKAPNRIEIATPISTPSLSISLVIRSTPRAAKSKSRSTARPLRPPVIRSAWSRKTAPGRSANTSPSRRPSVPDWKALWVPPSTGGTFTFTARPAVLRARKRWRGAKWRIGRPRGEIPAPAADACFWACAPSRIRRFVRATFRVPTCFCSGRRKRTQ